MATFDARDLDQWVGATLNRWPAVGFAVGIVRDGTLELFTAHGVADIGSARPIAQDTVFRIASITKTVTAVAIMQLWEQSLIDLDAPANDYLRGYQLVPAKAEWRPATVRHLLTHTAGIPQWLRPSRMVRSGWVGESVAIDAPLPDLAEYYRGRIRLATEPGTTFCYTDHGPATLGRIVEEVTGEPLDRYVRERIFEPLGMSDSDLLRAPRLLPRLATGYRLGSHGPRAVTDRQWVTPGASAVYSTMRDMAAYLAALLGGGSNEHGSMLKPETLAQMFAPQYQPDPRLPGMGLGFWRVDLGGVAAVEHQGVLPGFNSQIFAAPDHGVGVVAFTNGAVWPLRWLEPETARLLGRLVGARDDRVRTEIPGRPEVWRDLCGWYRPHAQPSDLQVWAMVGAGVQVLVRRGQLTLRALSPIPALARGFPLYPDDPDDPEVFRFDVSEFGLGTARAVFAQIDGRRRLHLEMPPISLERRAARHTAKGAEP